MAANERFLGRWARLKRDATVPAVPAGDGEAASAPSNAPASEPRDENASKAVAGLPSIGGSVPGAVAPGARLDAGAGAVAPEGGSKVQEAPALPSLESLGFDSDYSPFMRGDVDPTMRVSALKKLFSDPHFNVMDGLDVYIDDYGKPDPLPPSMLAKLNQSRLLGLFQADESEEGVPAQAASADAGNQVVDQVDQVVDQSGDGDSGDVHRAGATVDGNEPVGDHTAISEHASPDEAGKYVDADPEDSPPDSRRAS